MSPISTQQGAGCRERVSRWSSEAPDRILGTEQHPFPPRPDQGLYLDTEAEVCGHPVQLAALSHNIHVGLIHICHVLQVPRILLGTGEKDLV